MDRVFRRAVLSIVLAVLCVHYLESWSLPAVEMVRKTVLGEQAYTRALGGCSALEGGGWVHPATLSLTVYGAAQRHLVAAYGPHDPEVLQNYASVPSSDDDLRCIANYLLDVAPVEVVAGYPVRAMRYDIENQLYGLKTGWHSGLAQSFAGQVFLAAFLRFSDEHYLQAAIETANLLRISVDDGGVLVPFKDGTVWFEEYAQAGKTPPLILNGHLLALDYLYWMRAANPQGRWEVLFEAGVAASANRIGEYAGRLWSYYDAQEHLANHKYQRFHVRQLERYAQHDASGSLEAARRTMARQLWWPGGIVQRLLTQPSRLIIFLLALFSLFLFVGISAIDFLLRRMRKAVI